MAEFANALTMNGLPIFGSHSPLFKFILKSFFNFLSKVCVVHLFQPRGRYIIRVYGTQADTVAVMCHTATVVNLSFRISIVGRRKPKYFPFGFSQKRRMLNMCLLVMVTELFLHVTLCLKAARRLSSQASGILFVHLKWKPHPLCPQTETNSGNTGTAVGIP